MFQRPTIKAFNVDIETSSILIESVTSPTIIPPRKGTLSLIFRIEWTFKLNDFAHAKTIVHSKIQHSYAGRLSEPLDQPRFTKLFRQSLEASSKRLHDELLIHSIPFTISDWSEEQISDFSTWGFDALQPGLT